MVAKRKIYALANFGKKVQVTYDILLPSGSHKSEQEKVQDCSYDVRANSALISILVSMVSRMLNKKKEGMISHVENSCSVIYNL